jgi:putative ABC transport system permease protein
MWGTIVQLAWREIRANLMRSILTTLGIIVGVAAVVMVVTLGAGLTQQITSDIGSLGRNLLFVFTAVQQRSGPPIQSTPFKMADVLAIKREVVGVGEVSPEVNRGGTVFNAGKKWETQITGMTNGYFVVREAPIELGRKFSTGEIASGRAVCIVGATPRKELFGKQNPIGATIRVLTFSCEIIGILKAKGQSTFGQDQDDLVLLPLNTVQRRITGNNDIRNIAISAKTPELVTRVQKDLTALLRDRRNIREGDDDNFIIRDVQSITALVSSTTALLTAGLGGVAAISLLVGGIGIMNIMLVSVTERTREIGIRLAIGALERDVLLQFLIEAVLLSCLGGLIGAVIGLAGSYAATIPLGVPFVVSPWVVVVSFGFSAAIGIVFGFFPARRAARLDPIDALRYE